MVSKNPGGTKRATALADALEVDFGVITTAKRRWNMNGSSASQSPIVHSMEEDELTDAQSTLPRSALAINEADGRDQHPLSNGRHTDAQVTMSSQPDGRESYTLPLHARIAELHDVSSHPRPAQLRHSQTFPASPLQLPRSEPHDSSMGTSDSGHNVTIGRLVQGHIVDDDYPPPSLQSSNSNLPELGGFTGVTHQPEDRAGLDGIMSASFMSFGSSTGGGPIRGTGASMDDDASDNEDADLMNPAVEHEITLVGHVKGKTVLIVDDMIDSSSSWIAAAECCVKRGGARAVFLFATHGLFAGGTALEELEKCDCIEKVS